MIEISLMKLELLKKKVIALASDLDAIVIKRELPKDGELNFYHEVERFEISLILWALNQAGGKQTEAARLLGLKATTLSSMMMRYGMNKKHDSGHEEMEPDAASASGGDE